MPMDFLIFGILRLETSVDLFPFTLTKPVSGNMSKYISRISVVFPEPVGPIKKVKSPSSITMFNELTP